METLNLEVHEKKILVDRRSKTKLPCPNDKTSLLHNCMRNGVKYVIGSEEKPKRIYNCDLYKCPACHSLVLTDFGRRAEWNEANTPDMPALIRRWKDLGIIVVFENDVKRRAA